MVQGLAYVAESRGAEILVANARLNGGRQREQIDALVREAADALLVYPTAPPRMLHPALDHAVEAGIPLFSHDAVDHPAVITEFVTPGGEMAVLAAELMYELLEGRGAIGVVGGIPAPQIVERTEAFKRTIADRYPELKVVGEVVNEADDRAGARPGVSALLANHPNLVGLFTYNDASALGAADAVDEARRTGVAIVGCNGEPACLSAIREGRVAGTIERYPIELAQRAATIILDVLTGALAKEEAPRRVASEPEVITRENVDRFRPWNERTPEPDWERTCRFL
jgi:ribose transport system substrate-binding protein